MNTICLVCCAGYPNFGDEVICRAWIRRLLATTKFEIIVECPIPANAKILFGKHERISYQDMLWRYVWSSPQSDIIASIMYGLEIEDQLTSVNCSLEFMFSRIQKCKAIIFLGGGYIRDGWINHFSLIGIAMHLKRKYEIPIIMTGQSFMPWNEDSENLLMACLSQFDHISVRDHYSEEKVSKLNCFYGNCICDDTFLEENPLGGDKDFCREDKKRILICLQTDIENKKITDYLFFHINYLVSECKRTVYLLEFCPKWDLKYMKLLKAICHNTHIVKFADLFQNRFTVNRQDICIGTRYHFHLLCARQGAWGIFGSPDMYYGYKHDSLLDIGSRWENVDLWHNMSPSPESPSIKETCLVEKKRKEFDIIIGLLNQ